MKARAVVWFQVAYIAEKRGWGRLRHYADRKGFRAL